MPPSGVTTTALWHKQTLGRETQHFTRLSESGSQIDDDDEEDEDNDNHHKT